MKHDTGRAGFKNRRGLLNRVLPLSRPPFGKLRAGLGSTSLATDAGGAVVSSQAYLPFGAARRGQSGGTLPTKRGFTGQYADDSGLMYFNARYYDPYLNRWIQPDSIVPEPGNPQALNRYTFVLGNPLKYNDPSGHWHCEGTDCEKTVQEFLDTLGKIGSEGGNLLKQFNARDAQLMKGGGKGILIQLVKSNGDSGGSADYKKGIINLDLTYAAQDGGLAQFSHEITHLGLVKE